MRQQLLAGLALAAGASLALANDDFSNYALTRSYVLPPDSAAFDFLDDGRTVVIESNRIWIESAPASGSFSTLGVLPGTDPILFPAFVRVSPDGARLAVGDGAGKVGIFDTALTTGTWFTADHFEGEWYDDDLFALTGSGFSRVTMLDLQSPDPENPENTVLVDGIGGFTGAITFDAVGNLYTANGFSTTGPSGTGALKAFDETSWTAVLSGASPLDFETEGTLVVDVLSGTGLGFDALANLHIGGGDFLGATDQNFAAVVHADAVVGALTGAGPANPLDPAELLMLDPDGLTPDNFYAVNFNAATGELQLRSFGDAVVYVYHPLPLPEAYCVGAPNSVGPGSRIGYTGAVSLATNDLSLVATGNPAGSFGIFYYGADRTQVAFGDGFQCVDGQLFRLYSPVQIDVSGTAVQPLDFEVQPLASGAGMVVAGSNWNFQFWYRNIGGPLNSGFNTSNALSVTFCP